MKSKNKQINIKKYAFSQEPSSPLSFSAEISIELSAIIKPISQSKHSCLKNIPTLNFFKHSKETNLK